MAADDVTDALVRQGENVSIGSRLAGQHAPIAGQANLEPLRAEVRRRRHRVNFRQRYESRGVDSYRELLRAAGGADGTTLSILR